MTFKRFIKKYFFLFILILSTIILTVVGYIGKDNIYSDYHIEVLTTPQLVAVFEGAVSGKFPWMIVLGQKYYTGGGNSSIPASANNSHNIAQAIDYLNHTIHFPSFIKSKDENSDEKGSEDQNKGNNQNGGKQNHGGKPIGGDKGKNNNPSKGTIDPSKNPSHNPSKDPAKGNPSKGDSGKGLGKYVKVTEDYFADALFIGDSRTVGLSEYSGWTKPTYYADEGMSVYDVFSRKAAVVNGKNVTILDALKMKHFNKIYIMLGVNELGTGNTKSFVNKYNEMITQIKNLQPDSIIVIEGIMNLAKKKSDTDPIYNNKNIKARNIGLSTLANNKDIFYIDVNEVITDKYGNVPEKFTFDSIHLKAAYYKIWTEFLLNHGIEY